MKIKMPEVKNILDRITGRLDISEKRLDNLEDKVIQIIQNEIHRKNQN